MKRIKYYVMEQYVEKTAKVFETTRKAEEEKFLHRLCKSFENDIKYSVEIKNPGNFTARLLSCQESYEYWIEKR